MLTLFLVFNKIQKEVPISGYFASILQGRTSQIENHELIRYYVMFLQLRGTALAARYQEDAVVTPHIASLTKEAGDNMVIVALENFLSHKAMNKSAAVLA